MTHHNQAIRRPNYFALAVAAILIAFSGNIAIQQFGRQSAVIAFAIIGHATWFAWASQSSQRGALQLALFAAFSLISLSHILIFGDTANAASLGTILLLWTITLIASSATDWVNQYVRLMTLIAIISIALQAPVWLGFHPTTFAASFELAPMVPGRLSIGIHTYLLSPADLMRNSGPFWEPGAFSAYLIVAMGVILLSNRFPRDKRARYLFPIILALLTTQSTGGYLVGGGMLILAQTLKLSESGNRPLALLSALIGAIILVATFAWAFGSIPFLRDKIELQNLNTMQQVGTWQITRVGNLLYDLDFIAQRPLLGWSAATDTRSIVDPNVMDFATGQGNGLSGFLVRYGLLGGACYFALLYLASLRRFGSPIRAGLFVTALAATLAYEPLLNFPLYFALAIPPKRTR